MKSFQTSARDGKECQAHPADFAGFGEKLLTTEDTKVHKGTSNSAALRVPSCPLWLDFSFFRLKEITRQSLLPPPPASRQAGDRRASATLGFLSRLDALPGRHAQTPWLFRHRPGGHARQQIP